MLKTALLSFLLPPVGFATLAIVALLAVRLRPRLSRRVVMACVVALMVLALPAVSDTLLVSLEQDLPLTPPAADPPQAIVVLGAEIIRTFDAEEARVGGLTLERLRAGAALQRKTQLPVLVSGGVVQSNMPTVGALMAVSMAEDFRVPVRWTEAKSRDTWENAQFSAEILKAQGIHSIYVVTHPWHMRRAVIAFARTGLTVTAVPTTLDRWPGPIATDFMPRISAWAAAYFAMHEWIGCVWYSLRGS